MDAKSIAVSGVVQGVGFRPFVYGLALRHGLRGWVCNTSAGVEIVVEGEPEGLQAFLRSLTAEAPPLARIDRVNVRDVTPDGLTTFEIRGSVAQPGAFQPVSADVALCADCERELFDPTDRRYLYPFINCTHCGPRFTIIRELPYDRPATTMAAFSMCADCAGEYADPADRRFHAQPIACPDCGPEVWLEMSGDSSALGHQRAAIAETRRLLREGRIVAIKGLGGFHLACDAANDLAVAELRQRKGRVARPFALMAADLETVEQFCDVSDAERALLAGREKPIVLLRKTPQVSKTFRVSEAVAPGVETLGVMLPYTPLHHLLLNQTDPVLAAEPAPRVLVMTSGNFSEEPIATDNDDARERLASLADAFLLHNRDIQTRCDDSVVRVESETTDDRRQTTAAYRPPSVVFLRRSRGYAPYPVRLPFDAPPLLAVGGELKNAFCLARDRYAFLSHHIGDMENAETYAAFEQGIEHLGRLFQVAPQLIAYDLHPGYFSTQYALRNTQCEIRVPVQHHHAHIAACMADNGLAREARVIGLSFDGTGYGADGAIWGGEFLIADYGSFTRQAHLEYLPLPGGDAAIRKPWRIAVGYAAALGLDVSDWPFLADVTARALEVVRAQVVKQLNAPLTSSLGRLFDAVAALAGAAGEVTYEAQAAIELETQSIKYADRAGDPYPYTVEPGDDGMVVRLRELLSGVIDDARLGLPLGVIGARFHHTVAAFTLDVCRRVRAESGLDAVALSGGVWQNQLLLDLARAALRAEGFTVYTHQQTPPNDGGLALGQAVIAAQRANGR
jgi:hydrogenase maturation protein HypF